MKNIKYAVIVLFLAYGILIYLLVVKSVKTSENSLRIDRIESEYKNELKKCKDEAEKNLSEGKKAYYETLYHK